MVKYHGWWWQRFVENKEMAETTEKKDLTLILVRHGQGRQNISGVYSPQEFEFTNEDQLRTINEPLTEKGRTQARLVGERLSSTR